MFWFVVWALLVIGALVFVALLLRKLWFQAVELGRQLAVASDVAVRLADQVEALQAAAEREPTRATLFDDPDVMRARIAELREAARGRRAERAERTARAAAGWRSYWT
jgi:hypothetical protein